MNNLILNQYTLITGASSGIGKAFAYECAERNMNLLLVALPQTGLKFIANDIEEKFNVQVLIFETDLTTLHAADELYKRCLDNSVCINMLINNAGIGYEGEFEKLTTSFCEKLMQLNIQSMVMLTRLFVPELKKHSSAYILNVSSMASFSPMPYKSMYAASKSFVYSFTRALREELRNSSISVSVLCPGPVPTNIITKGAINEHGLWAGLMVKQPNEVAAIAIEKLLKGNALIVPGVITKIYMTLMKAIPNGWQQSILGRQFRKNLMLQTVMT
ncbi:MAG: SDR family oxidoreductase [Bacteroidia bacterium]